MRMTSTHRPIPDGMPGCDSSISEVAGPDLAHSGAWKRNIRIGGVPESLRLGVQAHEKRAVPPHEGGLGEGSAWPKTSSGRWLALWSTRMQNAAWEAKMGCNYSTRPGQDVGGACGNPASACYAPHSSPPGAWQSCSRPAFLAMRAEDKLGGDAASAHRQRGTAGSR